MDPATITGLFSLGKAAIERLFPDKQKRAEEIRKLEEIKQKGDLAQLQAHVQLMVGQLEINKEEAKHKSVFVAGWRPFCGWVGGLSLAYTGLVHPLLLWGWAVAGKDAALAPPFIESGLLGIVLTGMLGLGGMRSYDKIKGTQTDRI